jgi:predicted RNA polymerase sigma factor
MCAQSSTDARCTAGIGRLRSRWSAIERDDLTAEAIRLTPLIHALLPEDGEVAGLLALMLLTEARRTARVSASGELVTLDEQDRATWHTIWSTS